MNRIVTLILMLLSIIYIIACGSTAKHPPDETLNTVEITVSESRPPNVKNIGSDKKGKTTLPPSFISKPSAATEDDSAFTSHFATETEDKRTTKKESDRLSMRTDADESKRAEKPDSIVGKRRPAPSLSGLKASFSDDNKQFNRFVGFLDKFRSNVQVYPLNIRERIIISVMDKNRLPIPNAKITVTSSDTVVDQGLTYADGTFLFFPSLFDNEHSDSDHEDYTLSIQINNNKKEVDFSRNSPRQMLIQFDQPRQEFQQVPLDILFVMDTTGSMGEEINRLKTTIELIQLNLSSLPSKPKVRFGMVLYKDRGDEYISKVIALTNDLESFQQSLNKIEASGGGDTPEDLQAALYQSVHTIEWNNQGLRLAFVITDAPPQLKYEQSYPYTRSARDAKEKGIKYFSIGTGGLNLTGEYVLRQISQFTYGKYIFLTYGESDESEGGHVGSVSHHTGANFQSDKLEAIIIRFAKEELNHLAQNPHNSSIDDYFEATHVEDEKSSDTLKKLFDQAIEQLIDFSSIRIDKASTLAVVPVTPSSQSKELALNAEYFTTQAIQSVSASRQFILTERKNIQNIMHELKLQMSGTINEESMSEVGKLLGAQLLLIGNLYEEVSSFNLFLKLVRVETGEILAVTKALIDKKLGIGKDIREKQSSLNPSLKISEINRQNRI